MRWSSFASLIVAGAACFLAAPGDTRADEGQWMPKQIADLDAGMLRGKGLQLTAREVWNPDDGGIMAAIVNLSGCSAGFVSERGLVATNHHCAQAAIQAASSVDHDYLTEGFLATSLPAELAAEGATVKVLQSVEDVTAQMRSAAANEDPSARSRDVERQSKTLVAACEEATPGTRCEVRGFYNGSEYQLFRFLEFTDVRLVYAPPSSVGNYGGEVDNWMWPRHSGDFTLLRVYAAPDGTPAKKSEANVPYAPKRWLEVSPDGVDPGDFVAVLGFPGSTDRYLPAPEVERQLEQSLPALVELYGEWIKILEERGDDDPEVKIKVAATLRSLANRHKNARGMIEGIKRLGLLDRRKQEEIQLAAWADKTGGKFQNVLADLSALATERREGFERAFLLSNIERPSRALAIAIDLARRAKERLEPDLEREPSYMDRNQTKLWTGIERKLRDFDPGVDAAMLATWIDHAQRVPDELRPSDVAKQDIAGMLDRTQVTDPAFAKATFDAANWSAIEKSSDPMLAWAVALLPAVEANEEAGRQREGVMLELGPLYFEMLDAVREGPVYPDANGTLRFSYATVGGYDPRDGLRALPQTTVTGQVAKHTGEDPFDLPQAVRDAAPAARTTYWAAPDLADVPVCFLANADTTGGNSGSPVIDGRGRWVGLNFDRVWENIAGDFGYSVDQSRNINVDVRYLLWTLDRVAGAKGLLEEMGVAGFATLPARPPTAGPQDNDDDDDVSRGNYGVAPKSGEEETSAPATSTCACAAQPVTPATPASLVLLLFAVVRRRAVGRAR